MLVMLAPDPPGGDPVAAQFMLNGQSPTSLSQDPDRTFTTPYDHIKFHPNFEKDRMVSHYFNINSTFGCNVGEMPYRPGNPAYPSFSNMAPPSANMGSTMNMMNGIANMSGPGMTNMNNGGYQPQFGRAVPTSSYITLYDINRPGRQHYNPYLMSREDYTRTVMPNLPWGSKFIFDVNSPPPFLDVTRFVRPAENPVVKLSNFPFSVTEDEVRQFMKKHFLLHGAGDQDGVPNIVAIHIIMEKTNAKTQDCFVELIDDETKFLVLSRYAQMGTDLQIPKLGNRPITVEDSDQGDLMRNIFCRANNLLWVKMQGIPVMRNTDPTQSMFSAGFRGMVTNEELHLIVRYTLDPSRNPYGVKCTQRPYEMMMSMLIKYPWASPYWSFTDREILYDAYIEMLACLYKTVDPHKIFPMNDNRTVGLDSRLLEAFIKTGLNCPGLAEWQKAQIVEVVDGNIAEYGISKWSVEWPFECLAKPPGVSDQDIGMWLDLINTGASRLIEQMPNQIWVTKFLIVGADRNGRVAFKLSEDCKKCSFRDVAMKEYGLMVVLVQAGFEQWFEARGLDAGTFVYPAMDARFDLELQKFMYDVGVYRTMTHLPHEHGNGPSIPNVSHVPEYTGAGGSRGKEIMVMPEQQVEPELDAVFAHEDAIARGYSMEEEPTTSAAEGGNAPKFNDPFADPTQGITAGLSNLQFGNFNPIAVDRYDSQSGPPPTKAIEVKKPDGRAAVRRGSNQGSSTSSRVIPTGSPLPKKRSFSATKIEDPVGTPSRRQSSKTVSVEDTVDEEDNEDVLVVRGYGGKKFNPV